MASAPEKASSYNLIRGPMAQSLLATDGSICAPPNRDRRRPGLVAAATQEGRAAAENILRDLRGEARRPFTYHDRGNMATIGYRRAVAEFGARKLSGSLAWLLWSVVHVFLLIGFRSRVMVMGQWIWAYFTRTGSSPLITEYNSKRIEEDAGARLTLSRPDRDTPR
jgi:NDH2 C-terminal domain